LNNRGYGASLKTGAKNANGTFVLYLDADGQHDPSDIPNLLKFINTFDMIVGERKKTTSFIRYPMKKIISILANYLVGTKIPDLNSGFRVINKDIILKSTNLLPDGFSFTTTITLICFESGRSVKYLPIKINKRKKGKSTIHPLKDTIGFVMLILRIITLFNPLKVFLPVSIVFFFIALVLSLYELARYFSIGSVSTLFFITSLLIFCLGLLAEQISAVIKKVYGF
jgi:glycosyltransferase involved in cell wall biosynthesis